MEFAFLVRHLAVGVDFFHALIAGIAQQFKARRQSQTTGLEKSKVVSFARAGVDTENALAAMIDHDLSFLRMAFLLAGITLALFF